MEEEILEQPEDLGSKNYGKFKDAESLLKAYNSLEAEFTKKSQRLATLETETAKATAEANFQAEIDGKVDEFISKFENMRPFGSALKETLKNNVSANLQEEALKLLSNSYKSAETFATDEEFLNNFIYSNAKIKDKIVKDYLSQITQNSPIKLEGSTGSISLTPPRVPTTIQEAGKMAKTIIRQK